MVAAGSGPWIRQARAQAPAVSHGVMSGDVLANRGVVWSRASAPGRMIVEWSTTEKMTNPRTVPGPIATPGTGLTARVDLTGLPANQTIFYRVSFQDQADAKSHSAPVLGHFRTAPTAPRDIRFLWSGDTCGQGIGINPDIGGIKIYETMRRLQPDFFIHSGDTIYADVPIQAEIRNGGETVWRNLTTEAKSKVAETVDEFRGNYLYNLMDENILRFNADVPQIWQWDDHEVINNWSPGLDLNNFPSYKIKDIKVLAANSRRAFLEHSPIRILSGFDAQKVYRKIPYGPLLDVFVIDMRTYRAANSPNRQSVESNATAYLGNTQIDWLRQGLRDSKATWKVIASDMPLGVEVSAGTDLWENSSNGPGPAAGRELEIARLLRGIKNDNIRNVVWFTADVHYTAAHYYDPAKAKFTDFNPFWEFISGPLNAGTYGLEKLDETFGPEVVFFKAPPEGMRGLLPSAGLQFFGDVKIDAKSRAMQVVLRDMEGDALFTQVIEAAR
jgi:alkaline phosphatase D